MIALVGCKSANPIAAAETTEQRAYAAYGTYVIFAEKAADLAERPDIPNSAKLRLIQAEERASPVMNTLLDLIGEYETIRAEVDAGTTSSERLVIVSNNLNSWINRVIPLINTLASAVKGAE
jgi:hypothetical protein